MPPQSPNRALVKEAGFELNRLQTGYMTAGPKLMTFMYEGDACSH